LTSWLNRYHVFRQVYHRRGEGRHIPEIGRRQLLLKALSLHHDHSGPAFNLFLTISRTLIRTVVILFVCVCVCVCVWGQGKGFPDVNSRLMVRKLWDTLHIPIFALVDADPHGTTCLSLSVCLSLNHVFYLLPGPFQAKLTIPALKFLPKLMSHRKAQIMTNR